MKLRQEAYTAFRSKRLSLGADIPEGKVSLEYLGLDQRIVLKLIVRKSIRRAWTGLIWLGVLTSGGLFKCYNELSVSTKCGVFLDYMRNC